MKGMEWVLTGYVAVFGSVWVYIGYVLGMF